MPCRCPTVRSLLRCRVPIAVFLLLPLLVFEAADAVASAFDGKKVLWISSYHRGYEANDDIERGIHAVLDPAGVTLKTIHLDTKRNNAERFGIEAGNRAFAELVAFQPDVVIASDDNAQRFLVVPHLKNRSIPVVFCGVNWQADEYGYPWPNVTGMIEVDLTHQLVAQMARYAKGGRIGFLSGNVAMERKTAAIYNRRFFDGNMRTWLVSDMESFKSAFIAAQRSVDMLYIYNYTGIDDWDPVEAELFLASHLRIPTGTHNGFMAPFVTFTLAKSLEEHGRWAARTALSILGGTSPADIPMVENEAAELTVNLRMARAAGIVLPLSLLRTASIVGRRPLSIPRDMAHRFTGRRIFWVDSYHPSYAWSKGIARGLREGLYDTGAVVEMMHMDTKRNTTVAHAQAMAKRALERIEAFDPDVVIASDDNAQRFLVVPQLKDGRWPVVFCGVNWDAGMYGYPSANVTGVLEVDATGELARLLREHARGRRVGFISGRTQTDRKIVAAYNQRFFDGGLIVFLASDMAAFETMFIQAQEKCDLLIFQNNCGIRDWDDVRAEAFILAHTTIPTGSGAAWMAPFVALVAGQVAEEQGTLAAGMALAIMGGKSPGEIPVARNTLFDYTVNLSVARSAGIVFPVSLLKKARVYGRTCFEQAVR